MSFAKLFSSIIHSTVWREDPHVKIVWITMLALADRHGVVEVSLPGLADAARVSMENCEDALARLSAPDRYSRTKENEGRRIEEVDGGWRLLNYLKYRELRAKEERREQTREAVRRYRERVSDVSKCKQSKPRKAQAEAEAEADNGNGNNGLVEPVGSTSPVLPARRIPIVTSNPDAAFEWGQMLVSLEGTADYDTLRGMIASGISAQKVLTVAASSLEAYETAQTRHEVLDAAAKAQGLNSVEIILGRLPYGVGDIVQKRPRPKTGVGEMVDTVFEHWRKTMGHAEAKLTDKRKKAIEKRLADGYTVEQLVRAVDGCKASAFHQGQNDRGTVFDDLQLICRDGEHVEQFLRLAGKKNGPSPAPTGKPGLADVQKAGLELFRKSQEANGGTTGVRGGDGETRGGVSRPRPLGDGRGAPR